MPPSPRTPAAAAPVAAVPAQTARGRVPRLPRPRGPRGWNGLVVVLPAAAVTALGYHHRWLGDDALIYTRAVRQILAGNGPVYNAGERAETSTGTLWQWLVALVSLVSRADPALVAVALGLVCTAVGFLLAGDAARRLHGGRRLLPLGVLVLVPVAAVWDYATSGLESGLSTAWLALCWWLLVARRDRQLPLVAVVLGLGPLIRPDLALVSVVFLGTWCALLRPRPRALAGLTAAACALPLAYEIFRAGYYGVLVPLPGLTKEASNANWGRGLWYAENFVLPYRLWLPLGALAVFAAFFVVRRRAAAPLVTAPLLSGALSLLYVTRVGGDFMHGRMLLPGLFLLVLPLWAVPWSRAAGAACAVVAVWAGCCLALWRPPLVSARGEIWDTHVGYQQATRHLHPVGQREHAARPTKFRKEIAAARRTPVPQLALEVEYNRRYLRLPLAAHERGERGVPVAGAIEFLGYGGVAVPLDGLAVDPLSLAYPLGAHMERSRTARAGHEKPVALEWMAADLADPAAPLPPGIDPRGVAAARHALRCGPLRELQDSVRRPLTPARFWQNLTGSYARTTLRYPADPVAAEAALCRGP
ncbi:hypothetical protein [Streptomyces sp. NPDC059009]|uniref:hypothetical protein n=1 Tax=Streptomyces sp. NPDC059009 TaxID=3346694 RepID=UPI0036C9C6C4